jgi:valyl-tRNA synthetase
MVRDEKKRKMSKSLGNSPDALALIDTYGADGVRFGMMLSGSAGNDIIFDAPIDKKTKKALNESQLCDQGKKFCNKMWQGLNFLQDKELFDAPQSETDKLALEWFHARMNIVLESMNSNIKAYRLGDALMSLYKLLWNDFFSWYLELVKPEYKKPMNRATYNTTMEIYSQLMTMLHPFMPFVTEEIWHQVKERKAGEDCIVSTWPTVKKYDASLVAKMDKIQNIVTKTKKTRSEKGVSSNDMLRLFVEDGAGAQEIFATAGLKDAAAKMGNLSEFSITKDSVENGFAIVSDTEKYFLELNIEIDVAAERAKLEADLKQAKGFLIGVNKKLGNERFVQNAPAAVLEKEKQKLADGEARVAAIQAALDNL